MVAITNCIEMMSGMKRSRDFHGYLSEAGVVDILRQLSTEGAAAVFHITAQNAGVLVCKTIDSARFETFELSPTNVSVMATSGRLVRKFPATAIEISDDDFKDNKFLTAIAKTLTKMSHQPVQEMKGKAWKADQEHDEDRDTTDPRIVTELFTSILQGAGKQARVRGIRKNTREEVMLNKSQLPWRRSPLWLLIRVALQLVMVRSTGTSETLYKPFMVFLMAQVLDSANQQLTSSDALHIMMTKIARRLCKLKIGELWIAADKAAIRAFPMLEEYDSEVPIEVWQALLFSSAADMERLHRVELYLMKRQDFASTKKLPSVFRSYGEISSFPVRYFAQSTPHQEKKEQIELEASKQREAKIEEFRRLKNEYEELIQQYEYSVCEYLSRVECGITVSEHSYRCSRCIVKSRANGLEIAVHEWPLPMKLHQAQVVVFELDIPPAFASWRDTTIYLVNNVLLGKSPESLSIKSFNPMRTYQGLAKYFQSGHHRIHLLSTTAPHVATHRRNKSVGSSSEFDVCVNNGLRYQYYDESRKKFLSPFNQSVDVSVLCTFKLPKRAEALKPFLMRTWEDPDGKTPNTTIASQSFCPDYMSLGEFKALCVLPYGYRLSWINILTQLAMPTVDFNKAETATFLLQMSLQAGPRALEMAMRCAHTRPSDLSFGHQILQNLESCILRVKENWESYTALYSFTLLATRLLSLVSENLHDSFLNLIKRCRETSYRWLMRLLEKMQETADDTQRKELSETVITIALICVDSFNVEDKFMTEILKDSYQASILVEASIIIDNSSSKGTATNTIQNILLHRWRYTMHRARSILILEVTSSKSSCLNLAIKRRWPAFRPTTRWIIAESTCYWFKTTSGSLKVHLNILTGRLLVDGLPLSRLPHDFEEHHDYERLFGSMVLEVMPSSSPGMRFSTTKSFRGYTVHFGIQDSADNPSHRDLLIHLNGNGASLDLIPPRTFNNLLPHTFIHKYAHWYDHDTGVIEFCPLDKPWSSSLDNWRLRRCGETWRLDRHEETFLLAPAGVLAQRIAAILSPLEEPLSLHILYEVNKNALEVYVPRLQLSFLMDSKTTALRSKQYRGMQIDADQSIGTLVGLASKLVLRSQDDPKTRMVIIPEGNVQYSQSTGSPSDHHVNVSVTYGSAHRVQAWQIDNLLGRLAADCKVENKLYLAYIHALTSFCLPDPFLRRTGTEEALEILGSASVRAPCPLSQFAQKTLGLIAALAPGRSFCPINEEMMQGVSWSPILRCTSQDDRFYKITQEILARSREIDFLYPKTKVVPVHPTHSTMALVERAILRISGQHVSGFGAEGFTTEHDHFKDYLEEMASKLRQLPVDDVIVESDSLNPTFEEREQSPGFVSVDDLFCHIPPIQPPRSPPMFDDIIHTTTTIPHKNTELTRVIDSLHNKAKLDFEHHYLKELQRSVTSLRKRPGNELDKGRVPEWLLLECESGIMIREVQQQIAQEMIQPPDNENAVMQLNMGEGKSSVIVPIAAAALGDGAKLVRVVVAKPQAKQMSQMLTSKLSGLLDRPVYQLPFSRDIRMDTYRAGPIEHSPDRWNIIQEVLGLVRDISSQAKTKFPHSMEFDDRDAARFPKIRFLGPKAEKWILSRVAQYICEEGITGFPISHQPPRVRQAVHRYITQQELLPTETQNVETGPFWAEATLNHILLLRGLLSGGVLSFALSQKRWRVNYGMDPNRETKTKLAVPFRAKDNPTPRSEFSHPDVVITLTCLSYYYGGLDDEALFSALSLLIRSDNCAQEYLAWVATAPSLPEAFKHLQGINLRDRAQCTTEVFPCLRYSKAAIDYYLCRMVFAKESKEFPHKLSASGWDLGKRKVHPTTGFSGTNDSRYVLPLEITQLDPEEQKHTNALVLEYLLRPDNGIALMTRDMNSATFDSKSLLQLVANLSSNTRVILDVGAQVIDLNNLEFARKWLSCYEGDEHTQAAIFFNELDELVVLDRFGKIEELQVSPFADQLDECLVFLDEAHTRGTDLRLPAYYQAAVTLGANLTKDRLVQACMRMRKLGKGQTVVFCIPREIERKILLLRNRESSTADPITASDVLCWVITETCLDLRRAVPLWLNQGVRFYQQQASWDALRPSSDPETMLACARQLMEDEAQSLSVRYRPQQAHSTISSLINRIDVDVARKFNHRCQAFGLTELRSSTLQEEQERELSPETEEERQIERPPPVQPAIHDVHPSLVQLVTRGLFSGEGTAFSPSFKTLSRTSAANHFELDEFKHSIWTTHDFATTVKGHFGSDNYSDSFQRPVQWVLALKNKSRGIALIIISPYEAQNLLHSIEVSKYVTLHQYAPRVNLGFQSLDHLALYSIPKRRNETIVPRDVVMHLNLFAGQLYLSSFDDYTNMCDTLGLAWRAAEESVPLGPDGFIPPGFENGNFVNNSGFSKSPVRFLKVLMAKIRQECELIEKTHVGKILEGERLHEDDFAEVE
ncbi:hypothetical protein G7Z17_g1782 [Cylindrodendrum hubeiense]|uniref:ubiquitinyl hydrolase 1 n=1 Tax=Cylindrodendrum hubeiense TaxID=595255 RepID=A0A9P5HK67_9HYPO|nr:hypothetical protein G7Z17_g1782 [Cylindrodendrum hubeiense]